MTKKNEKSQVHVKLDYSEAIQSKKSTLSSEADIIKIIKSLQRYRLLRKKELVLKQKLFTKIKGITPKIKELESSLPEPELPKRLQSDKHKKSSYLDEDKKTEDSLENQLRDIQKRLNAINNSVAN